MTQTAFSFDRNALDVLFPNHLRLDIDGTILGIGPTLCRLLGNDVINDGFFNCAMIEKPPYIKSVQDIAHHSPKSMTISLNGKDVTEIEFRGIAYRYGQDGHILIDLALGTNMLDVIARFDLTAKHFKPNDMSVNLLYAIQAQRTVLEDSQKLATQLVTAKENAERVAGTDAVTGIGNRHALQMALEKVAQSDCQTTEHAILQIDLNKFKAINDAFGHAIGDGVLRNVDPLSQIFREIFCRSPALAGMNLRCFCAIQRQQIY